MIFSFIRWAWPSLPRIRGAAGSLLALSLAAGYVGGQALAADHGDRTIRIEDPREGNRLLLAEAVRLAREGRPGEALTLYRLLELRRPEDRDLQLLFAITEVAAGKHQPAIQRLSALSAKHPDWPRPRVELALAHEAAGDVRKAKAILIDELGKDPPPAVRRNIETRIRELEDRQTFVGRVALGVVPDSNASGGTYNSSVEYLGLPLQLNDDAKQQSGVRLDVSAGGTVRTPWDENMRVELAGDVRHSEPLSDAGTPTSNVRLSLALRRRGKRSSLRTGMALQPFYYDNELQRREQSLFLEAGHLIGSRHSLVGNLTLSRGAFADTKDRDFRQWEANLGPKLAIGASTALQLNGIFGRRNAKFEVYSFLRRGGSLTLLTVPADGWRLSLSGALIRDIYQEESLIFGRVQEDIVTAVNADLAKTGTVIWGFSPSIGAGYSDVRSTINLYDKRSYTLRLGFARPF